MKYRATSRGAKTAAASAVIIKGDHMYPKKKERPAPAPSLRDRIEAIRLEVQELVAARVALIKAECPGVPEETIRRSITRGDCPCATYQRLTEGDA
jgi:hypothetical protein